MEHLIQHFRKEEQPFIEQVVNWVREVEDRYAPKLTDFLDPRQRFIVNSIIGQYDTLQMASGGLFNAAERQRMLIYPTYYEPVEEDFQLTVFTIQYPIKFVQLRHPDVLGALLSLGLNRGKFGDIRVDEHHVQFVVANEIAEYVRLHLTGIGKVKVHVESMKETELLLENEEEWLEESHTVSSMRLDVIIATILKVSRQKAQALITGNKVRVNWTERDTVAFELQEGDILSIRGSGRVKILMTEGRTKKDKIRLQVGRLTQKG
ncbi:RNA-binding protein [Lysinibacillus pakistanensis]|uniref:RNA-binding protein n=1 Tax=Lysinibacillus pakistanensis TaxID=759811 RepID=A0AAX3X1U1_9BACI|nr:RNA-binding protein [Lysinibacillus pakistanensis]MDM5232138.1 RNA-binding protein [Lysinibacillus pakistanensis]WHY47661.1 RNA-binding protein [Lysinibacillus pakistanensis]WHY52672.1 RNA-binding protein [Lysinibacillus pakistanensis]